MRFYDLFAGIGGFRLGLERAGHECIGSCEIDKYARQIYAKNFGHEPEHKDARQINPQELPQFDILCAGFPCQAFSISGRRMGFEDTRGTLCYEIFRIIREKQPSIVLLENVKAYYLTTKGEPLESSSNRLLNWGMTVNGNYLTANIIEFHNIEKEYLLSDILEDQVDEKYYLSEKSVRGMLNHKDNPKNCHKTNILQPSLRHIGKDTEEEDQS